MPPVRFHLDESADGRIADGLRIRDRDCTTSKEAGLLSSTDEEQLAFAIENDRVLITRDSDFAILNEGFSSEKGPHHPGIIYWCSKKHFGAIVKEVDQMCSEMSPEEFKDKLFCGIPPLSDRIGTEKSRC